MTTKENSNVSLSPVKKALLEIRDLRQKLAQSQKQLTEPIAVIGLGCRFPGSVSSSEEYWALLENGVDAIVEIPAERWDIGAY